MLPNGSSPVLQLIPAAPAAAAICHLLWASCCGSGDQVGGVHSSAATARLQNGDSSKPARFAAMCFRLSSHDTFYVCKVLGYCILLGALIVDSC